MSPRTSVALCRLTVALVATGAMACRNDEVCAPFKGRSCIALEVRANRIIELDQLSVSSSAFGLSGSLTPDPPNRLRRPPLSVAVVPPEPFTGAFRLEIVALRSGLPLADGIVEGTLARPGEHVHAILTFGALGGDLGVDAGVDLGVDAEPDLATVDLVPAPPPDHVCTGANAWSQPLRPDPDCSSRSFLDTGSTVAEPGALALVRTPSGRMDIAHYNALNFDEGELVSVSFRDVPSPVFDIERLSPFGIGNQIGIDVALAAGTDDTVYIAWVHATDQISGEVFQTTIDESNAFGTPVNVLSPTPPRVPLGLGRDVTGRLHLAWWSSGTQTLGTSQLPSGGSWSPQAAIEPATTASAAVGAGQLHLHVADGLPKVAHHRPLAPSSSQPVYYDFDGASWGARKTLDNLAQSGEVGHGVSAATRGTRHVATYFSVANPGASATVTLRLADWTGAIGSVPVSDLASMTGVDSQNPAYRARVAIDRWGLIHVAWVRVDGSTLSLEYLRQYPDGVGGLSWLSDEIYSDPAWPGTAAELDFLVDEDGQPHLAFAYGFQVWYATRTDR